MKGWEISQFCIYNEIIDIHAVDQQISIKLEFDLLKDLSYKSKMEGMPCPGPLGTLKIRHPEH